MNELILIITTILLAAIFGFSLNRVIFIFFTKEKAMQKNSHSDTGFLNDCGSAVAFDGRVVPQTKPSYHARNK